MNRFKKLGSGPGLGDFVNGKEMFFFVVKRPHFSNCLDFICTWTLHSKNVWTVVGLGLSFKNSGLDLDRKI